MSIQLKSLKIERKLYGENEGRYIGEAEVDTPTSQYKIELTPENAEKVLATLHETLLNQMVSDFDELLKVLRDFKK